jgi:hypothetical protein
MNTTHHFVAGWIMQAVLIDSGGYEPPFPTAARAPALLGRSDDSHHRG